MWVIFCIPVSFVGTFFGRHLGRSAALNQTNNVNQLPRMIPPKPWYHKTWALLLWTGMAPFSTIFVELFFVYTALFHYKFYYMYGFMELIFILLLFVTMAMNVIVVYFTLNNEDHKWQWVPSKIGFSVGLYVFLYSLYYYTYRTNMSGSLQFVHFVSMNITLSIFVALMCSSVGFYAANLFVSRIYRVSKFE